MREREITTTTTIIIIIKNVLTSVTPSRKLCGSNVTLHSQKMSDDSTLMNTFIRQKTDRKIKPVIMADKP